mmetsp:Transcript_83991/g.259751  ORF Transcript_83991/g.259751 Transcript_83991/m.259751 type:complete len:611 (-) Transcript_83991:167-1999(-)
MHIATPDAKQDDGEAAPGRVEGEPDEVLGCAQAPLLELDADVHRLMPRVDRINVTQHECEHVDCWARDPAHGHEDQQTEDAAGNERHTPRGHRSIVGPSSFAAREAKRRPHHEADQKEEETHGLRKPHGRHNRGAEDEHAGHQAGEARGRHPAAEVHAGAGAATHGGEGACSQDGRQRQPDVGPHGVAHVVLVGRAQDLRERQRLLPGHEVLGEPLLRQNLRWHGAFFGVHVQHAQDDLVKARLDPLRQDLMGRVLPGWAGQELGESCTAGVEHTVVQTTNEGSEGRNPAGHAPGLPDLVELSLDIGPHKVVNALTAHALRVGVRPLLDIFLLVAIQLRNAVGHFRKGVDPQSLLHPGRYGRLHEDWVRKDLILLRWIARHAQQSQGSRRCVEGVHRQGVADGVGQACKLGRLVDRRANGLGRWQLLVRQGGAQVYDGQVRPFRGLINGHVQRLQVVVDPLEFGIRVGHEAQAHHHVPRYLPKGLADLLCGPAFIKDVLGPPFQRFLPRIVHHNEEWVELLVRISQSLGDTVLEAPHDELAALSVRRRVLVDLLDLAALLRGLLQDLLDFGNVFGNVRGDPQALPADNQHLDRHRLILVFLVLRKIRDSE